MGVLGKFRLRSAQHPPAAMVLSSIIEFCHLIGILTQFASVRGLLRTVRFLVNRYTINVEYK